LQMRTRGRYTQIEDEEWVTWDWRENQERCCDCHLVHFVSYRLRLTYKWRFVLIQQQNYRDGKITKRTRRYYKRKGRKTL
jgi:hypothetical protein